MPDPEKIETVDKPDPQPIPDPAKKEDVIPDSSGKKPDDGPSFVKKVMDKIGFGKDKSVELEPEEVDKQEVDIPEEFTKVAMAQGWSEEDIVEFASDYSDTELKEMIPFLLEEAESEPVEKPEDKEKETPSTEKVPDEKVLATIKEEIRKELRGEIDALKKELGESRKDTEAQKDQEARNTINAAFDEAGKTFEVFGQTKDLPVFPAGPKKGQYVTTSPQLKARDEVFQKAVPFIKAGVPVKDAMEFALTWYKGKNLEGDVKRSLIKDLKKNEEKLSAKRTSKETVPTYEDEEEYRKAFILKEAEKLGMKLTED